MLNMQCRDEHTQRKKSELSEVLMKIVGASKSDQANVPTRLGFS